jgi:hypothetical protein
LYLGASEVTSEDSFKPFPRQKDSAATPFLVAAERIASVGDANCCLNVCISSDVLVGTFLAHPALPCVGVVTTTRTNLRHIPRVEVSTAPITTGYDHLVPRHYH